MHNNYLGILCIGDPHLSVRVPGFRKDNYFDAIVSKLEFALQYADDNQLLPIILGDLFHRPRDNANKLLTKLMRLFDNRLILAVTGNHDTTERDLQDDDSLSVVASAGKLHLLDRSGQWHGTINSVPVQIGGSTWSQPLPKELPLTDKTCFSIWVTHHNIGFTDEEEGWLKPYEIPGIDLVVNGHIHRPLPDKITGMTTWINPGSIARVQRTDALVGFVPTVLKLVPQQNKTCIAEKISLPHAPFEDVFYPLTENDEQNLSGSAFIKGLESIQTMRTAGGAGLVHFIHQNINQFDAQVANIILQLVKEVCPDEYIK